MCLGSRFGSGYERKGFSSPETTDPCAQNSQGEPPSTLTTRNLGPTRATSRPSFATRTFRVSGVFFAGIKLDASSGSMIMSRIQRCVIFHGCSPVNPFNSGLRYVTIDNELCRRQRLLFKETYVSLLSKADICLCGAFLCLYSHFNSAKLQLRSSITYTSLPRLQTSSNLSPPLHLLSRQHFNHAFHGNLPIIMHPSGVHTIAALHLCWIKDWLYRTSRYPDSKLSSPSPYPRKV